MEAIHESAASAFPIFVPVLSPIILAARFHRSEDFRVRTGKEIGA